MSGKLLCPFCGDNRYKTTRKGGITRCCGSEVVHVNGNIYAALEDAPEWKIIQQFVEGKRSQGIPRYNIPFGSSSYKDTLPSVKFLLKECTGDVDLAMEVVRVNFDDPSYKWKNHFNFRSIIDPKYLQDAIGRAHANLSREQQVRDKQEQRIRVLDGVPDRMKQAYDAAQSPI